MEYFDLARHITEALEDYGYARLYVEELSVKAGYSREDSKVLTRKSMAEVIEEAIKEYGK